MFFKFIFIHFLLFQFLPLLIYAQNYCDMCGYEFKGEIEEKTLRVFPQVSNPVGVMITLEYDNVEMGAGSYSKVYHATLKKRRGNSLGGKNREQLGCIAFKKTSIPNDPNARNSVELMQMNEFEVLKFICTRIDGPDKIPRIFYSLLEWGGGGSFRDYIFEKHNEWGCGRRKWEINDNKVFGVTKEPVIVLKELNDKIVHLDFKPNNLIFVQKPGSQANNGRGILKAIDFGSVKVFDKEDNERFYKTIVFQNQRYIISEKPPLSSEAYRSPEHKNLQCSEHNICPVHGFLCPHSNDINLCPDHKKACPFQYLLSVKSDVWAIGIILFQIVMGDLNAKVKNGKIILNIKNNNKPPNYGQILIWINEKYKMVKRDYTEWYLIILKDSENIFIFLMLILQTRICCTKTYLLIIVRIKTLKIILKYSLK
uniref:Protein kinase domain-containing protein n=1 Tax=Meloidogyne enterolobii TaxID=390850 RepID=A0A6V7VIZ3_MELEN|nr:unnamed protein product [Meloidogyne enterolobii]